MRNPVAQPRTRRRRSRVRFFPAKYWQRREYSESVKGRALIGKNLCPQVCRFGDCAREKMSSAQPILPGARAPLPREFIGCAFCRRGYSCAHAPFSKFPQAGPPMALAKDKDVILAYTLTPNAVRRLRESGVRNGRRFPASILGLAHPVGRRPFPAAG